MTPLNQKLLVLLGLIAVIELGVIAYYQIRDFQRPLPVVKVEMPAAPAPANTITMPDTTPENDPAKDKPAAKVEQESKPMPTVAIPGTGPIPGVLGGGEMTEQVRQAVAQTMAQTLYQNCMNSHGDAGQCDCMRNTVTSGENIVIFDMATRQATVDKEAYGRIKQVVREKCGLAMK